MLILERKESQRIYIGNDIVITICKVDKMRNKVKVGIEAPDDIQILREELYELEQEKCRQAHNMK